MSNNKTSPRLAAGFFGAHYHPKTVYKDLAPEVVKQEEKTTITNTKSPTVPALRERVIKSLLEASLQPQNPLAIFAKD